MGVSSVATHRGQGRWIPCAAFAALVLASGACGQAPVPNTGGGTNASGPAALLAPFAVDGDTLKILLPRGSLTVGPSSDDQVHVRGVLSAGQRLRHSAMPGGRVVALMDEGRLFPAEATLDVQVPTSVSLSIDVDDARLDLAGVGGARLRVDGGNQPVRVSSAAEVVQVRSRSGSLALDLSGSRLSVGTVAGDVDLSAPTPGVRLAAESVSGTLRLQVAEPGPMRVDNVSGRIELRTGQGQGPVSLETVSGDIELRLAEQASAALRFAPGVRPVRLGTGLVAGADGLAHQGGGQWPLRLATLSGGLTVLQGNGVLAAPGPVLD